MADPVKIVSEAQRLMFEKAAADPEYARSRGITRDLAHTALAAHKAAGSPKLPDRVGGPTRARKSAPYRSFASGV